MKKIFIYYSSTGNGDLVAEKLKKEGYDIRKVIPEKELPKLFFFKMMVGGFKAIKGYKAKLVDFDNNIEKYDEVVIGSPIWASNLSTPINTVLDELNLEGKKVSFIFYSGSGEENNQATEKVKEKYNASVINIREPKKNKKGLDKIELGE